MSAPKLRPGRPDWIYPFFVLVAGMLGAASGFTVGLRTQALPRPLWEARLVDVIVAATWVAVLALQVKQVRVECQTRDAFERSLRQLLGEDAK